MFKVGCFNFAAVNVEIDGRFEKFLRAGKKVGSKIVDVKNPNAEKLLPFLRLRMQNRCVTAMRVDNDEILYAMLFHAEQKVLDYGENRRCAQRHGAGKVQMLKAVAIVQGRKTQERVAHVKMLFQAV